MIAIASIDSRVADRGRSRGLASNRPYYQGSSAVMRHTEWISVEESMAYDEVKRPRERGVRRGLKKMMVEERGARTFIAVESDGRPVHAPCLMRRPLNSGGKHHDWDYKI